MSNVLFLFERDMATVSETKLCYERMFKETDTKIRFNRMYKTKSAELEWADILCFIRPDNTLSRDIAKMMKKAGKMVIFFMDDDLLNLPEEMPQMPWRRKALQDILSVSDMIISSSPYIIDKYKNLTAGRRWMNIDTAVPDSEVISSLKAIEYKEDHIKKECNKQEKVKIVFAAGMSHETPFLEYIKPCLSLLSERYSNSISLSFVGVHPDIDPSEYKFEVKFNGSLPLTEYRKFMRGQNYDIGLAPMIDTEFTRCKYFNKYIEYGMVGIPGIYSHVEPYTYVIKDKVNGIMAKNDPDSWYKALCDMIDSKNLRLSCAVNALNDLKENFNDRAIRYRLETAIPEFHYEHRSDDKSYHLKLSQIKYKLLRICDLCYLTFFFLKRTGIKGVISRTIVHVRESKNYR